MHAEYTKQVVVLSTRITLTDFFGLLIKPIQKTFDSQTIPQTDTKFRRPLQGGALSTLIGVTILLAGLLPRPWTMTNGSWCR